MAKTTETSNRRKSGNVEGEVIVRSKGWFAYLGKYKCGELEARAVKSPRKCPRPSDYQAYRKGDSGFKRYPCYRHLAAVVDDLLEGTDSRDVLERG